MALDKAGRLPTHRVEVAGLAIADAVEAVERLKTAAAYSGLAALALYFALLSHDLSPAHAQSCSLARAVAGFTGGWAACRLYTANAVPDWIKGRSVTALGLIVLATIFGAFLIAKANPWLILPLYPLLILGMAARQDCAFSRVLSAPKAMWAGDVSYSVYLIHPLVVAVLSFTFARLALATGPLFYVAVLVASAILGTMSYRWLERSMRERIRGSVKFAPRTKAAAAE